MSLRVWILTTLLCTLPTVLSQGDINTCDSGYSFITQPPEAFPCNPYPSSNQETTSLLLECSVTVPQNLITASTLMWNKAVGVDNFEEGRVTTTANLIYKVSEETESVVLIRSILEVRGLSLNNSDCVGRYFCQVHVLIGGETVFSNASTVIQLLNSSAYTDLDRCSNIGGVFLSEASQCLSLDSTISLPPPPPPSEEEPPTSCHDTPTSSCSTTTGTTPPPFTMETIIVIASVGGGLALLVCFLLFVLLITCCCLRKPDRSKASLRTFKDRSIPLSASSMSNINMIESGTSQSNLVTTPIQIPLSTQSAPLSSQSAPSHPPPVRTTLPTRSKQTVTQKDSSCSVSSTAALIRKGRAATVVGKLKTACTPTDENSVPTTIGGGKSKFETGPVYKSLIVRNMDDAPIYSTASLNGSMEHLDKIDHQPVYSEPNIPLSVSMLSLISEQDNEQPQYTEPYILPHAVSSLSLHSPTEHEIHNGSALSARSRLSLPLNKKLSVSPFTTEEQPIYSEVDDWRNAPHRQYTSSSNESSPVKRKPMVPPRPHTRQTNKLYIPPETVNQSECSIQRESIDGEYVCPNEMLDVEAVRGRSSSEQPRGEVFQLRNRDIAPPPHMIQGDRNSYLTLYN